MTTAKMQRFSGTTKHTKRTHQESTKELQAKGHQVELAGILKALDLPPQEEKLVITTAGIVHLGALLAQSYLAHR